MKAIFEHIGGVPTAICFFSSGMLGFHYTKTKNSILNSKQTIIIKGAVNLLFILQLL
jgi:hypothetical protein